MNALLFIGLNLLAVAVGILVMRFWLHGRSDAESVHLHLCNAVMWLGCLVCIAGLVLTLVQPRPSIGFSLCSTGLLVIASMILKRRELMRRSKNKTDKKDSN